MLQDNLLFCQLKKFGNFSLQACSNWK